MTVNLTEHPIQIHVMTSSHPYYTPHLSWHRQPDQYTTMLHYELAIVANHKYKNQDPIEKKQKSISIYMDSH